VEIVCPACHKTNTDDARCRRCGADLQALSRVRRSAASALKIGAQHLRQKDGRSALRQAEISWRLKRSAEAARLAFLACLLLRRFEAATLWYKRAVSRD
jgi:hypothetical protein